MESEHLVKLELKDGSFVDFHRDADNTVRICRDDFCVQLPDCPGEIALKLFALLETQSKGILEENNAG